MQNRHHRNPNVSANLPHLHLQPTTGPDRRDLSGVLANGDRQVQPHIFSDFGEGVGTPDVGKLETACQATCAVPGLLAAVRHSSAAGATDEFSAVDSSRMNPVSEVIDEARRLLPGRKIAVVVSLGAGMPPGSAAERSNNQWIPVMQAMDEGYIAAEAKAQMMAAEQDLLSWTNYYRFSIAESAAQVGMDELAARGQVKKLSDELCADRINATGIPRLIHSAILAKSRSWVQLLPEEGHEVATAVIHSELLTLQRLLRRCDQLYYGMSVIRNEPFRLLKVALQAEEMAKKMLGAGSDALSAAVAVTEWLRTYLQGHRCYQSSWDIPTDPLRHSETRHPWGRRRPSLKELTMALVPCHKSNLEHATYVLDNFFDVVFPTPERAQWIWRLANQADVDVRGGSWLKTVHLESLQVSSDVLQLLATRLARRFPDGPWSPSTADVAPPRGEQKARPRELFKGSVVVPARAQEQVDETYNRIREDYTRDPRVLTRISDVAPGLEGIDPLLLVDRRLNPLKNEYRYSPLPYYGNFTRVIVLHPCIVADDEQLRCDIELLDLNCEPYTYDAVSYVWGEPRFDETLHCGPGLQEIAITPTLASTLRSFRSRTTSRRLWVDAVCINQGDIDEKSHQVAAMGLIYQRARATLIYLGDKAPGQERYMFFLLKLAQLVEAPGLALVDTPRNNQLIKEAMMEAFGAENALAVEELSKLAWFGRRWIIQEAALCQVAVVFFGRSIAKLDHLTLAMAALANSSHITSRGARGSFDSLEVVLVIRNHRARWRPESGRRDYAILDLLIQSHFSQASEPRDHLYALLSVALDVNGADKDGVGIILWPDYTQPLAETYTAFAMKCLQSSPTLDVLHCAGAFRHVAVPHGLADNPYFMAGGPLGLPSFVPDWTAPRRYTPLVGVARFTAGFVAGTPPPRIQLDQGALVIPGLVLDTAKIQSVPFPSDLLPGSVIDVMRDCHVIYYKGPSPLSTADVARILTADHALLDTSLWFKSSHTAKDNAVAHAGSNRRAMRAGLCQLLDDWRAAGERMDMDTLKGYDSGEDALLRLQCAATLCKTMAGRSFFISEKGLMGIAPCDMRKGDVIAVLFGARTPFVLRPSKPLDGRGLYTIVGDCYVDGFMEGKALRVPKLEKKDFRIC